MEKAFDNCSKTNDEILKNLELGELPTLEEISQLSATVSDPNKYKDFIQKVRFAHEIELIKGDEKNDSLGYLLKREGWPNTRDDLEKVLALSM